MENNKIKVLVTGGSGFIGSHIGDALILERHDVIVFDRVKSSMLSASADK